MSAYIATLKAAIAADNERADKERAEKDRADTQAVRERLTPLEGRLSKLLATIPLDIQREGLSLPTLQVALRGRWRRNCQTGELGAALRKLGFKRDRRWHGDIGGFYARWYPAGAKAESW